MSSEYERQQLRGQPARQGRQDISATGMSSEYDPQRWSGVPQSQGNQDISGTGRSQYDSQHWGGDPLSQAKQDISGTGMSSQYDPQRWGGDPLNQGKQDISGTGMRSEFGQQNLRGDPLRQGNQDISGTGMRSEYDPQQLRSDPMNQGQQQVPGDIQYAKEIINNVFGGAGNMDSVQQQYYDRTIERYEDLTDLSSNLACSKDFRKISRRLLMVLLESLSSSSGGVGEQKFDYGSRQTGQMYHQGDDLSGTDAFGSGARQIGQMHRQGVEMSGTDTSNPQVRISNVVGGTGVGRSRGPGTGSGFQTQGQGGQGDLPRGMAGTDAFSGARNDGVSDFRGGGTPAMSGTEEFRSMSRDPNLVEGTGLGSGGSGIDKAGFDPRHREYSGVRGDQLPAMSGTEQFRSMSHDPNAIEGAGRSRHGSGTGSGFRSGFLDAQGQPNVLSGPRSLTSQRGDPNTIEGATMDRYGMGSEFSQQDTEHTRKDYKVVIRGQELEFLNNELSTDSMDRLAEEAQNICVDISSDENLKESTSGFVRLIKSASHQDIGTPQLNAEATNALEDIKTNLKSLLDRMTDGYDFCKMENAWNCLIEKTTSGRHDELERDWKEMFTFIKESFLSKRLSMSYDWRNTFASKLDCLRPQLMSVKPELFNLLQEFDCLMTSLKEDKLPSEQSQSAGTLSKNLFVEKNGKLEFKPEALKQIRDIIAPEIIEQFKYVDIPTFREQDDSHFTEISNAVFRSEGLIPDDVLIQNRMDSRMAHKDQQVLKTSLHVWIKNMNFDIREMHIKYHRKSFPQVKDEGDFNVRSSGSKGMTLEMWLSPSSENNEMFKVDDVDVTLSGLRIYESHVQEYSFLFSIFKPLMQSMMRRQVEKAVENKIRQTMFNLQGLKGL